jgi:hypothetical protein
LALIYLVLLLVANLHRVLKAIIRNLPYQELQVANQLRVDSHQLVDLMEELNLPLGLEAELLDLL